MHACDVCGPESLQSLVFNPVEGKEELDGTKRKIKKTSEKSYF